MNTKFRIYATAWKPPRFISLNELVLYGSNKTFQEVQDILNDQTSLFTFQRFTGAYDKNGNEIYDGDIVKCYAQCDWFDEKKYKIIYEIRWCKFNCGWRGFTPGQVQSGYAGSQLVEDTEVIGNVCETPNLIQ